MRTIVFLLIAVLLFAKVGSEVPHAEVLDTKVLKLQRVHGVAFSEISDLAYDARRDRLYMIGDDGKLYLFAFKVADRKIGTLRPLDACVLRGRGGRTLHKKRRDSEGLTFDGSGRLWVSFEGRKARVAQLGIDAAHFGRIVRYATLPTLWRKHRNYRGKNKKLEAIAWHPRYGLISVAERAMRPFEKDTHTLFSLDGKHRWRFRAEEGAGVTAIETTDRGNLLVLERAHSGVLHFDITLSLVTLCKQGRLCPKRRLLHLMSGRDPLVDNFEGLTRIGKGRYLMISDDNDLWLERTILHYLEVRE